MTEVEDMNDVIIDVGLKCPYCGHEWNPKESDLMYDINNRLRAKCPNKHCAKVFIVRKNIANIIEEKAKELGLTIKKNVSKEERDEQPDDIDLEVEGEGDELEIIRWHGEEYTPEDLIMTKGLEGVYILMERELEKALKELPMKTVSDRMINYVVKRFKSADWYKQAPEALTSLLQSVLKISPAMIQDIVNRVFSIPRKYENIIRLAMQYNPHMFYDALNTLNMQNTMITPPTPMSNPFNQLQQPTIQPMQMMPQQMVQQQPFDMRSWLMNLVMSQQMQPQMPTTVNQETQNDGRYVTKDELIELLDSYFERKKKEEKEEKLYDLLSKITQRLDELEERIKKKDEDEEEDEGRRDERDELIEWLSANLSSLQSQLDELRKRIEEGGESKKSALEELVDAAKKLRELENIFGSNKENIPPEIMNTIQELQKRIETLTGEIKPETLKLQELQIMKEMKKDENETLKYLADRIASAIENIPSSAAYSIGQLLAMQSGQNMARNIVPMGDKVLVLCPKCGKEFTVPADVEEIKCPDCGYAIAKKEGS